MNEFITSAEFFFTTVRCQWTFSSSRSEPCRLTFQEGQRCWPGIVIQPKFHRGTDCHLHNQRTKVVYDRGDSPSLTFLSGLPKSDEDRPTTHNSITESFSFFKPKRCPSILFYFRLGRTTATNRREEGN